MKKNKYNRDKIIGSIYRQDKIDSGMATKVMHQVHKDKTKVIPNKKIRPEEYE